MIRCETMYRHNWYGKQSTSQKKLVKFRTKSKTGGSPPPPPQKYIYNFTERESCFQGQKHWPSKFHIKFRTVSLKRNTECEFAISSRAPGQVCLELLHPAKVPKENIQEESNKHTTLYGSPQNWPLQVLGIVAQSRGGLPIPSFYHFFRELNLPWNCP